jgi:hypothetical protein
LQLLAERERELQRVRDRYHALLDHQHGRERATRSWT